MDEIALQKIFYGKQQAWCLSPKPVMMRKIFIIVALASATAAFSQKKDKQAPPPKPPKVNLEKFTPPPPPPPSEPPPPKIEIEKFASPSNADYKEFLKRNPTVKSIGWMENNKVRIYLKSGGEEIYDLKNEEEAKSLKEKYGELPVAPPPPPKAPKTKKQS